MPGPEPFRIKMVEPLHTTTREFRLQRMAETGYNLFRLNAEDVFIDLLTDSGTGAMSDNQWAGIMLGDESYAGSRNFRHLAAVVEKTFGYPYVLPAHQGRGAEHVLLRALLRKGSVVPGNTHFDTTRAHIQLQQARAVDLPVAAAADPTVAHPFKGNMDVKGLQALIRRVGPERIPLVLATVTSNGVGGQPMSLANLRAVRQVVNRYGIPLFLDAARFAENAYFIQQQEAGWGKRPVAAIVREMAALADGCVMSGKKDGLVNIGGFVALRDEDMYQRLIPGTIAYEGFVSYGGLAGRDLEAFARGLEEVVDEAYLAQRVGQVGYLGECLRERQIPIVEPVGGHGVYVDMKRFLSHIPPDRFPGQAFCVELYLEAGVRAVEVGTVLAGRDPHTGRHVHPELELVRLAVPRRTYTDRHMEYVAAAVGKLWQRRDRIRGMRMVHEPPILRHFTAGFAWEEGGGCDEPRVP